MNYLEKLAASQEYATHLPVLYAAVMETTGPVIEFGAGWFSTPLLHELVSGNGRTLISVERDDAWRAQFVQYADAEHLFLPDGGSIESDDLHWVAERFGPFSVALIDSTPYLQRAADLRAMLGKAEIVICHDVGYNEAGQAWNDAVAAVPDMFVFDTGLRKTGIIRRR